MLLCWSYTNIQKIMSHLVMCIYLFVISSSFTVFCACGIQPSEIIVYHRDILLMQELFIVHGTVMIWLMVLSKEIIRLSNPCQFTCCSSVCIITIPDIMNLQIALVMSFYGMRCVSDVTVTSLYYIRSNMWPAFPNLNPWVLIWWLLRHEL